MIFFEILYKIKSRKKFIAFTIFFKNDKNVLFFIEKRTKLRKKNTRRDKVRSNENDN